jgi:hypothetical protein
VRSLRASDPAEIGPYRPLAELGRGGMGRVLLAGGVDGRLVAVKLVRDQITDQDGFRDRFQREVDASRQVSGADTAAVIDADPDAATPWLASVFVPGPTPADALAATGPLPVAGQPGDGFPFPRSVYRWLPGCDLADRPSADQPNADLRNVAVRLGQFLSAASAHRRCGRPAALDPGGTNQHP